MCLLLKALAQIYVCVCVCGVHVCTVCVYNHIVLLTKTDQWTLDYVSHNLGEIRDSVW